MTLFDLPVGGKARLAPVREKENVAVAGLLRLGVEPLAEVRCLFAAPPGDPRAYRMGKVTVALRAETARVISVLPPKDAPARSQMP